MNTGRDVDEKIIDRFIITKIICVSKKDKLIIRVLK